MKRFKALEKSHPTSDPIEQQDEDAAPETPYTPRTKVKFQISILYSRFRVAYQNLSILCDTLRLHFHHDIHACLYHLYGPCPISPSRTLCPGQYNSSRNIFCPVVYGERVIQSRTRSSKRKPTSMVPSSTMVLLCSCHFLLHVKVISEYRDDTFSCRSFAVDLFIKIYCLH